MIVISAISDCVVSYSEQQEQAAFHHDDLGGTVV